MCGDDSGDRAEDSDGVACREAGRWGRIAKGAAEACGAVWAWCCDEGCLSSFVGDRAAVDEGDLPFDCCVVEEVSGCDIVCAVDDELDGLGGGLVGVGGGFEEVVEVGWCDVDDGRSDDDFGIDGCESLCSGDGLWVGVGGVAFGVEGLALEVSWFDDVAVGDSDCSDACACEPFGGGCSECAAADDEDVGVGEAVLTLLADVCEQSLAVIAVGGG